MTYFHINIDILSMVSSVTNSLLWSFISIALLCIMGDMVTTSSVLKDQQTFGKVLITSVSFVPLSVTLIYEIVIWKIEDKLFLAARISFNTLVTVIFFNGFVCFNMIISGFIAKKRQICYEAQDRPIQEKLKIYLVNLRKVL